MKIILSRKGFDGKAGGYPSIVYKEQFYSFPIPQNEGKGILYKDLIFDEIKNKSYAHVFKDLGIKDYEECHLDPDFKKSIIKKRNKEWKPLFGQAGSAEAHLENQKVNAGDIFLFFGWFKFAEEQNDKIQYCENKDYQQGFHAIYGYLQVEKRIDIKKGDKIEDWMAYHPHYVNQLNYNKSRNSIFVSTDKFNEKKSIHGAGLLKFDDSLILTGKNCTRGVWHLDEFFNETTRFSRLQERIDNAKIRVSLKGYYPQELMIDDTKEVINWATELISKHSTNE